jgi:hypothetical protein
VTAADRLEAAIDELQAELDRLTPEERQRFAEHVSRAARLSGVSLDEATSALRALARAFPAPNAERQSR